MTTTGKEQAVFRALADPMRRLLLETLSKEGAKTATELAQGLRITRQGVTKHMKILVNAELVHVEQHGRERLYEFVPDSLDQATDWVTAITQQWDKRLQALSRYLTEDQSE